MVWGSTSSATISSKIKSIYEKITKTKEIRMCQSTLKHEKSRPRRLFGIFVWLTCVSASKAELLP
jgi:hypothetical protein